ncbi:EH signature domain-containing protein [Roseateles sp. GG27B]
MAEIARARRRVLKDHGGAAMEADPRSILAAIADFRRNGQVEGFRDLIYVCLGVGAVDTKGLCVLADEKLRAALSQLVESQPSFHRRMRCFQALLSSYWIFPLNAKGTAPASLEGWLAMRTWLRAEYAHLSAKPDYKPPWFDTLPNHIQLLSNQPCDSFGADLLRGDASSLNTAVDDLSIPNDSWVIDEAVFAQMKAGTALKDEAFKEQLPDLLSIASGRSGVQVVEGLEIRCIACLVSRYARCSTRPEQPLLQGAATTVIGNPWLRRANWDAWVRHNNEPDDQAREMVFGWLKGRLITNFFELLSADGVNDGRRLAYWLRFAPFVEDMWFALGMSASARQGDQFRDFRERARGRLLDLEGTTADNNAFVMRIGAYLAIEFGASGNAFFLFRWDSLKPHMLSALTSGRARQGVSIGDLKHKSHEVKLRHVDSPAALKSWEQKFDDTLKSLIGKAPEKSPACVPALEDIIVDAGVHSGDFRNSGGALWIYTEDQTPGLAWQLTSMGFASRQGRGWYKDKAMIGPHSTREVKTQAEMLAWPSRR